MKNIRDEKLNTLKHLWAGLSLYYRTQINSEQIQMYAEDLEDLDLSDISRAIKMLRNDPTRKFLPMPSEIREKIVGDSNQDCVDAANRIVESMAKFGHTNHERAKVYMGELAWLVVQREGGWQGLCERTSNQELPILKAQWRELAKSLRGKALRNSLQDAPGVLPVGPEPFTLPQGITKSVTSGLGQL